MARSGPQKPVMQHVTRSGQPQGVVENVGACCCGYPSLGSGAAPMPPGGWLLGGCLQPVWEVVHGWDAFLQAFVLACLHHHLTGQLVFLKGLPGRICLWSNTHWGKAWPPVLDLRSAVKPAEGANSAHWEAQVRASRSPGRDQDTDTPADPYTSPEGSLKGY